jgi:protein tyrosine/serine phosphatase
MAETGPIDRHLDWDGCCNVRDLGGLATYDGRATVWGAVVRSDCVDGLTPAGWAALRSHGVRTIVDLRDASERDLDLDARPTDVLIVHRTLEDQTDQVFWAEWRGDSNTPLYYRAFVERFPDRCADVLAAIARAQPGGVLIHCVRGRDRTGLVVLLLLALVGVAPDEIAADHALSTERLRPYLESLGRSAEEYRIEAKLTAANTTSRDVILGTLASFDVEALLRAAGLTEADVAAIRHRMLE